MAADEFPTLIHRACIANTDCPATWIRLLAWIGQRSAALRGYRALVRIQRDAALAHLKEAARGFAAVDTGGTPRPEIWMLVEW